jgi:NitT/TauT family transport system permease protein
MTAVAAPAARSTILAGYVARTRRRRTRRFLTRLAILVIIIGGWEIIGRSTSRLFLVPFSEAVAATFDPDKFSAWATSLQAFVVGYALAAVCGIAIGLVMGRFRLAEWALNPYLTIVLAAPMVALIPIFIIIFGFSLAARVAIVFSFSFVYIAVNTLAGAKSVRPELNEMANAFRLSEWQRFKWIVVPGAAPLIMTGLRLGFGRATIGMLLSEMLLLAVGIGGELITSSNRFDTAGVLAIVLMLLAFSWTGGSIIEAIDRRINRWQRRPA